MRTAVISYVGFMTTMLLVVIISIITMKSSYYEIIRQNLDDSLEYTISMIQLDRKLDAESNGGGGYANIEWSDGDSWSNLGNQTTDKNDRELSNEVMKKKFVEYLASNIDSKVDTLDIEIYGVDAEYGLISAKVTAEFEYPFGAKDEVSVRKTIVLNKEIKEQ